MIDIYKLLNENKNIDGWKVNGEVTESYELFFVHEKLETVRATDTESTVVTVYVDHDGKKGLASFKIFASTSEDEAREKIAAAASKAALISNEYYELPADEKLDGEIRSNISDFAPRTIAAKIAEAVFSADTLGMGSINALEVFINKYTVTVRNSRGIDKREIKYSAMLEAIPTWNEGDYMRNLTIKGCTFTGNARGADSKMAAIGIWGEPTMTSNFKGNQNIDIINNTFNGNYLYDIVLAYVTDATVTGNTFGAQNADAAGYQLPQAACIDLYYADQVTFSGNTFKDASRTKVQVGADVTNVTGLPQ
jgi:hypothetical protein